MRERAVRPSRVVNTPEREARLAWPTFARFLPPARERDPSKGGRPRIPDEVVFEWVCWMLRSGCAWRHMPRSCPTRTVQRRLREWRETGVFERWASSLRDDYLPAHGPCFMDACFIRARVSGPDIGLTRHGKGCKLQLLCDWRSRPVAWRLTSAHPPEARLASELLSELEPLQRPSILIMDKAYRSRELHAQAAATGIRSYAPQQSKDRRPNGSDRSLRMLYRERWRVERPFAWLAAYRRISCRYERSPVAFGAWLALAIGHILLRDQGGFVDKL